VKHTLRRLSLHITCACGYLLNNVPLVFAHSLLDALIIEYRIDAITIDHDFFLRFFLTRSILSPVTHLSLVSLSLSPTDSLAHSFSSLSLSRSLSRSLSLSLSLCFPRAHPHFRFTRFTPISPLYLLSLFPLSKRHLR